MNIFTKTNIMNIDKFFKTYTGENNNVSTWTPEAIKEFAEEYHTKQLNLLHSSIQLKEGDMLTYQDWKLTFIMEKTDDNQFFINGIGWVLGTELLGYYNEYVETF